MLNINLESAGGAILARLSGELDRSAREPLLKAVRTEAEASGGKVVLDCANLSALDSEGVRALLALQTWLRIKDSEMAIAALPTKLEDTIKSDPGVDQFLARHAGVNEALTSLGLQAQPSASSPRVETPPPAAAATLVDYSPPPVAGRPPSTRSAPATPATPATPEPEPAVGGWGPPVNPAPSEVKPAGGRPVSDPPRPASSPTASPTPTRGAWETPIETPEPVAQPGPSSVRSAEEPVIDAPAGAWGAPPAAKTASTAAAAQPATPNEPVAWAKGPPPRRQTGPAKKSKKGLLIAVFGVLAVAALGIVIYKALIASPKPPTIGPNENYTVVGEVGAVPTPSEVIFQLTNVKKEDGGIRTYPATLESWVSTQISGSDAECTVKFTFSSITGLPKERSFHLEAQGLDGTPVNGTVVFEVREPNAELVVRKRDLKGGSVGSLYRDLIELADGSSATFTVTSGGLPPGITLRSDGSLRGTPTAAGEFRFTVAARRGDDSPASETFLLNVEAAKSVAEKSEADKALLQEINLRIGNIDLRSLTSEALGEYQRFSAYLTQINENPADHVRSVVTVTFPLGKVTVESEDVEAQLAAAQLDDWLTNRDVRFVIAGFADTVGGEEVNRRIIRARAKSLETVIENWLVNVRRESRESARARVVVIPNKPSDNFEKARAAECWLFRPPSS